MSYYQPPYPPAQHGYPYRPPPEHPQGTLILVLGVLGFVVGVTGIFAWVLGSKALNETKATGVRYANEQLITIGRVLGIISTILFLVGLAFIAIYFVFLLMFIFGIGLSQ